MGAFQTASQLELVDRTIYQVLSGVFFQHSVSELYTLPRHESWYNKQKPSTRVGEGAAL